MRSGDRLTRARVIPVDSFQVRVDVDLVEQASMQVQEHAQFFGDLGYKVFGVSADADHLRYPEEKLLIVLSYLLVGDVDRDAAKKLRFAVYMDRELIDQRVTEDAGTVLQRFESLPPG